ncbi:DEAD/DEAH box helicase [Mesorhizobium sp. ANAO-SY3R2]|uniref:DEAD/DEAH box helicase n=1 Tax=Mesorhizobium sp. ANAO-SY3R2 TaxID=3166644 RepID=UPI00366DC046
MLNELKPLLGLELTATPFIESPRGRQPFRNVVYEYPLARAMEDGFVKEPAVVTRENFNASSMSADALERLKLDDAIRLHENTKAELQSYARQTGQAVVKPFVLVIARDTTHAASLTNLVASAAFFEGRYAGKVIQVDSSAREEETIARLLKVESADEPTEIVIHVNMLREGWDVTNLYTIVPLRAASAHTLVHQTVGRGLRLLYGQRTGVSAVDRLNIVAHDRFQEMIEEARKPGSPLRLREVVIGEDNFAQRPMVVECAPNLLARLGLRPDHLPAGCAVMPSVFGAEELPAAVATWQLICEREAGSDRIGSIEHLRSADVLDALATEVARRCRTPAGHATPELAKTVATVAELVIEQTIAIPRIVVGPRGQSRAAFQWFRLDVSRLPRSEPDEVLWASHLRTGKVDRLSTASTGADAKSPEDQLVRRLSDFNDVAYDACAELLHDLAGQVLRHLRGLMGEEEVRRVLRLRGEEIAALVHAQMQEHVLWQQATCQEVAITRGFTALRCSAFATIAGELPVDFRLSVSDKSKISRHLFFGFHRCLYPIQKSDSEAERRMALILDREADKWLRPARGQFQMFYRLGAEEAEYVPDFVAEYKDQVLLIETKAATSLQDADVRAKRDIAVTWCAHASDYARMHGGKPWTYLLVPHDAVLENITIAGLVGAWRETIAPTALFPAIT